MAGLVSIQNSQVLTTHMYSKNNIIPIILEKIEKADRDFSLFGGCGKILVALSGGADSTCLLLCLHKLASKHGFSVYALHVNHGIRGTEADRDEKFARNLCEKYGIQFFCEHIDIPSLSKSKGISEELCARDERSRLFEKYCKDHDIPCVAVAHNSCDNTETVLFNLLRGSGTKGLCGIPPKRSLCAGVDVIRPLIYAERCEIEKFLSELGQDYVTDSTNLESEYSRNYIRNEIIPLMKEINPSLHSAFSRTSSLLRQDSQYLDTLAENYKTDDLSVLSELDKCILSRIIRLLFSRVSCMMPEEKHINELCDKIYSFKNNNSLRCRISFPDGKAAFIENRKLSFDTDFREKKAKSDYRFEVSFGFSAIPETDYAVFIGSGNDDVPKIITQDKENIYKIYTTNYLWFDTIPKYLFIRNRCDGDKIFSKGINKRLKKLMSESKLSENERTSLPLLCFENEIIAVPGICVSDTANKNNNKLECLTFNVYKLQSRSDVT